MIQYRNSLNMLVRCAPTLSKSSTFIPASVLPTEGNCKFNFGYEKRTVQLNSGVIYVSNMIIVLEICGGKQNVKQYYFLRRK
jgi:hypothetical protein